MPDVNSTVPVTDPLLGKVIDNYRIQEIIGRGGMGVVYKARDITLDRDVAAKMMDAQLLAWEQHRKRFEVEAKALARLKHQNIVDIYALRHTEHGLLILMEYVEGKSLQTFIQENAPVTVDRTIEILTQVLSGLVHAHQHGVVHRDIKPANVLLDRSGTVKITDFGLAKLINVAALTQAGSTMGSPAYMSPEQIRGEDLDHRSDIWSVGVLVYEMLAGKIPFSATEIPALQYQITSSTPPPARSLRPDVPEWLDSLISRCMAKDRDRRPKDCAEILYEISKRGQTSALKYQETRTAMTTTLKGRRGRVLAYAAGAVITIAALVLLLEPILSPRPRLTVNSQPAGAAVVIGRDTVGVTPLQGYERPTGTFPVRVLLQGYVPAETVLTGLSSDDIILSVNLEQNAPPVEEAVSRLAGIDTRQAGASTVRFRSVDEFATFVADVLGEHRATSSGSMAVIPFGYEDTGFGDQFSILLKNILEAKLSAAGRWTLLDIERLLHVAGTPGYPSARPEGLSFYLRGTYRQQDDSLRVTAAAVMAADGVILAAVDAIMPAQEIRRSRLQLKPKNLSTVLGEKASYAYARPTEQRIVTAGSAGSEPAKTPPTKPGPGEAKPVSSGPATSKSVVAGLKVDLWTNKGRDGLIFTEGDTIVVHVQANKPCYLRMVYHLADGRRILPTGEDSYRLQAGESSAAEMTWEFECSPPFGGEYLHVFARTGPFDPVQVSLEDGYWVLRDPTDAFVAATRGIKPLQSGVMRAEASLLFTTMPKSTIPLPQYTPEKKESQ